MSRKMDRCLSELGNAAVEGFIQGMAVGHAEQQERMLRAMGAQGDGRDLLFELSMDLPYVGGFPTQHLRVLLRGDPPVSLDLELNGYPTDWGELSAGTGKALSECAGTIQRLFRDYLAKDETP